MSILSWLKKLLNDDLPTFRPRPADWSKTLDDLDAEKRSLSGEEIEWARDYEREQLRSWARFPKDGEIFETIDDLAITFMISSNGPYSGSGRGVLPKGTHVRVHAYAHDPEPVGVYATPLDKKRLEQQLVPELDRLSGSYRGYSLFFKVAQLNRDFRLVAAQDAAGEIANTK